MLESSYSESTNSFRNELRIGKSLLGKSRNRVLPDHDPDCNEFTDELKQSSLSPGEIPNQLDNQKVTLSGRMCHFLRNGFWENNGEIGGDDGEPSRKVGVARGKKNGISIEVPPKHELFMRT